MNQKSIFTKISERIVDLGKITESESEYFADIKDLSFDLPKIIQAENDLIKQGQKLRIGIIGQVKAGKSSFLNALLFQGEDLLPKASTPMTAGLTVIGYGEEPKFKVEYYSKEDWNIVESQARQYDAIYKEVKNSGQFEDERSIEETTKEKAGDLLCSSKELLEGCNISARGCIGKEPTEETLSSVGDLQGRLHAFVGAKGEFTSVTKTLYLYLPEEGLKGFEIVDTPGVNDPIVSREERTNEFLRSCHGVFLLSYTGQFCSNTDLTFLKERVYDQGINKVVVLGSKFDSGLNDIVRKADGEIHFAFEHLASSLTESLKENFAKRNFRNELPELSYISGLCYALYHKPENKWDENEAHIARLLTRNYPEIGKDKEWFRILGNIEEIKETYIEKNFKINRDTIISRRHQDFVESNNSKILKTISNAKFDLEEYSKKVDSLNISDIEYQKTQRLNVEKLGRASRSIIDHASKDINSLSDTFFNQVKFEKFNHHVYLQDKSYDVNHDSGSWYKSNNKFQHSLSLVDSGKLKEVLNDYLEKITEEFFAKWSAHFSEKGSFVSKLKAEILNLLKGEFSGIDPEIFQDVLNDSLKDISRCANSFPKVAIEKEYKKRIRTISSPSRGWKYKFDEAENPKPYLDNLSAVERDKYSQKVNDIISDYKEVLRNEILDQKDLLLLVVKEMKSFFKTNIAKKFDEVTAKYEEAVKEKDMKLKALADAIQGLIEIEEIINTYDGKRKIETATGVLE